MTLMLIGAALFVGGHFLLSSAPIRTRLVASAGEIPFMGIYSAVAFPGLWLLIMGYNRVDYIELWPPAPWTRWLPTIAMPAVLLLIAGGYIGRNPTAIGRNGGLDGPVAAATEDGGPPRLGMIAITRHPALWGVALFALSHIPPNGDVGSLILFGALAVLALGGAAHIDAKLANRHPDGWRRYAAVTSYLPFAALAAGRVRVSWRDVGWAPLAAAVVLYAVLLHLHTWLFGVSPFATI